MQLICIIKYVIFNSLIYYILMNTAISFCVDATQYLYQRE